MVLFKDNYNPPNIYRRIRNATGLSQRALAKELGVMTTTVTLLELGHHKASSKTLKGLCAYLTAHPDIGITANELLEKS